jgi:hypothetical protein
MVNGYRFSTNGAFIRARMQVYISTDDKAYMIETRDRVGIVIYSGGEVSFSTSYTNKMADIIPRTKVLVFRRNLAKINTSC